MRAGVHCSSVSRMVKEDRKSQKTRPDPKLLLTGEMKLSQNWGHLKNRSTIERRCVERHPHPNPLPDGAGA